MSTPLDLTAKYQLEQVLSWTGLGRTFRGRHPQTRVPVAVKVLSLARTPSADVLGQRFLMTGRVLSSLTHHTLPEVVDYGLSSTGDAYLVTAWFEGEPLTRATPVEPRDLLSMVVQLTQGLESLALHGLVHLNLTPDNILVDNRQPRLTGWGHSLLTVDWQSDPGPPDSQPNAFTAPELCESRKAGDALWRADLYSLGAITASLLGADLERNEQGLTVRFRRELSAQLQQPELLRGVLERCLLIDATKRLDSYSELARAIQHAMPRGRGADRSVSDTQPLEKIQPEDVEQVARRLQQEEEQVEGRRSGDRTGGRRDLFDLRTLNPELSATAPVPKLDEEMAQELTERLDDLDRVATPDAVPPVGPAVPVPHSAAASAEGSPGDTAVPPVEKDSASTQTETGPIDPTLIQSVRLRAQSSDAPTVDPTLITTAGDLAAARDGVASAPPTAPEPDLDVNSTRIFPAIGGATAAPDSASAAPAEPFRSEAQARETSATDAPPLPKPARGAAPVATPQLPDLPELPAPEVHSDSLDLPYDSEDPTVVVRSDAVRQIRSGVLPVRDGSDGAAVGSEPPTPEGEPAVPAKSTAETSRSGGEATAPGEDVRPVDSAASVPSAAGLFEVPNEPRESKRSIDSIDSSGSSDSRSSSARSEADVGKPAPSAPVVDMGPRIPIPLLAAAGMMVLMMLLTGLWFLMRSRGGGPEPETRAETPAPAVLPEVVAPEVTEPETSPLPPELLDALELFVGDDLLAARGALQEVAELVEAGELPPEVCAAFLALDDSVLQARVDAISQELSGRLRRGQATQLRRLLGGVDARERTLLGREEGTRRNLAEAERAMTAVAAFERAERSGEPISLLDAADELTDDHPRFAEALDARDSSAAAVEARAGELEENGQLEEAISLLERLLEQRPERSGPAQRIATIRQQMRSSERFDTLAEAMERASARGRPSEGLSMLQGVEIPEDRQGRFRGLEARLETQLAELDGEAPVVALVLAAEELAFRRGEAVVIAVSVGDDYEVRGAQMHLRSGAGVVQVHDLEVIGEKAEFTVSPDFHGDRSFELWVVARDISGNEGFLGGEQQPVEIRRRRWFRR